MNVRKPPVYQPKTCSANAATRSSSSESGSMGVVVIDMPSTVRIIRDGDFGQIMQFPRMWLGRTM